MTDFGHPDPTRTWMEVVALLTAAADRALTGTGVDPGVHSLAVGAQIVASSALALLPAQTDVDLDDVDLDDVDLDDVDLGPQAATWDVLDLIRAAELAARRCPIEVMPVGASAVIVALGDLVGEAAA